MNQSLWGYCLSSWAKILLIYSVPFSVPSELLQEIIWYIISSMWYMKNALCVRPVSNILNYTKLSVKQSGVSCLWCASCHSNWLRKTDAMETRISNVRTLTPSFLSPLSLLSLRSKDNRRGWALPRRLCIFRYRLPYLRRCPLLLPGKKRAANCLNMPIFQFFFNQ